MSRNGERRYKAPIQGCDEQAEEKPGGRQGGHEPNKQRGRR